MSLTASAHSVPGTLRQEVLIDGRHLLVTDSILVSRFSTVLFEGMARGCSVIYYNPLILDRLGPDLSAFFMAHERAHISLQHSRSAALGLDPSSRELVLQEKELEGGV